MKKIVIIVSMLVLITGCTNINKLNYSDIVNNISTSYPKNNVYRTGYSYYLPRGMQVSNSTMYNEVIEDANIKYYLYVDVVSYENKIEKEYQHYFYKVKLLKSKEKFNQKEFECFDIKYKWFSFEEFQKDERIQKVNSDIIQFLKSFDV